MKKRIKKVVSFLLVFMTVFSTFSILPGEVFHTAYVRAAETLSSALGANETETYTTDDFTYILTDDYSKVQIVSYIGSGTDVVIPDRIDNKKVTSVGERAFYNKSITSVTFGQFVETIGNYAFYGCKSIESVEFPDSLTSIGYQAFINSNLKSVKFGSGLQTIGSEAFYRNEKLTTVEFTGNSLTSIGSSAFEYCYALTEVSLTGNNAVIGNYAFYNNTSLKKVSLGSGIKSIGAYAFRFCSNLETVDLSPDLTSIGTYAFQSCKNISSIAIPDGVTTLENYVFASCTSLKTVSIGSGCKTISATAFIDSPAIEEIKLSADNENYSLVDGVLMNKDKTAIILYPKSRQGEYVIPDTVTTISPYAFDNCPNLTGITIGANVAEVGNYAFRNCTSLAKAVFKNSDNVQKKIGEYAFNNCTALSQVNFGNAVTSIGSNAFNNCKSIESIEFPDSLTSIGYQAFINSNLKSVKFGSGLQTIGSEAFYRNEKLTTVEFTGNSLTSIGSSAFEYCYALTEVSLTGNNAVIGNYAFYYNTSLKKVSLGSGIKSIGAYAFRFCSNLETVDLSPDLTSIGTYAFQNCKNISSIAIPDGVTTLENYVFASCTSLKTVSIGSGCKTISATAFIDSPAIEEITLSEDNANYSSVDGALLNKEKTAIILYPKSRQGEYVIPDTVTTISAYAFDSCPNLTGITIGTNVAEVGNYAFRNCTSLAKAVFKNSDNVQKKIGEYSFYNCTALSQVDFGNAVTSIGSNAFNNCKSIESIEFPDSLTSIGYQAFTSSNLKSVKFGSGLQTIGSEAFYRNEKLTTVEFTGNSLTSIGSSAFEYCYALTEISLTGNNAVIGNYAFYYNTSLKKVSLGSGIKSIGAYAFRHCSNLETVDLSPDLTSIGTYAFHNCKKLSSIAIPDGVTDIENYVFASCTSLKTVSIGSGCKTISATAFIDSPAIEEIKLSADNENYSLVDGVLMNKDKTAIILYPKSRQGEYVIPDTVTTISPYAFDNCLNLTGITIGANVAEVGNYAFRNCTSLAKVVFKNSDNVQKKIGEYSFYNCTALSQVDFGNAVTSIGSNAFNNCKSIESIEFPDSLTSIGYQAFTSSNLKSVKFGSGLQTIGSEAFYRNEKLTTVEFTGNSLTSIGSSAFEYCYALTEIDLTGNNVVIGSYAFYNNTSLKKVSLGSCIKSIGSYAFRYCSALEEVNIGNDVETIDNYAFANCQSLNKMVLGKGITSIGNNAITGYSNLTVYCFEDTYAHTYALGMSNVDIKLIRDNYYVVDLKISAVSSKSVTLSWKKPNGYDTMDHYVIFKNGIKYDETTDTSYTDINLTSGEEYTYTVVAVDADGIVSQEKSISVTPACASVKSITLPGDKTNIGGLNKIKLTATMGNSLSKTGGKGEFLFSSNGGEWETACTAAIQSNGVDYVGYWSLESLTSGEYSLRFLFTDKDGGQSFKDIDVTVDRTHPAPIDEVTITPMETYISLSWQISVEYDTNIYRIYRKAEYESEFELISEIRNRDVTNYADKNVKQNVTYYYYVVGTDSYGQESLKYDVVSAGLIDDIVPPQFIKMTPSSNSYIYGNTLFTVSATDNVGLAKTELYYSVDPEAPLESWKLLDEHNGSSYSQRVDTTVIPNGVVYIVAKLYDAVGNYSYSTKQKYMCDNQGPEQIKNVKCIAVGGTTATLSWDNVSDDDIAYFVVECKQSDETWAIVSRTSTSLGVNLSGLTPEKEYVYRVTGYDKRSNRGVSSEEIVVTTQKDTIAPKVTRITPDPGYFRTSIPLKFTVNDDYIVKSIRIETSIDKVNWSEIATLNAESNSSEYTFEYKLDLTDYEEGSVFVRAFACDSYSNVTDREDLTCYEYIVDRTPPEKPTGVTADSGVTESGSSFVCISWNAVTNDNSFAYYRVYKSDSENGDFCLIKDKLKTVNTYDEDVEFSSTYYYKVECVDLAGNISEQSQAISCRVNDDTEIPVIHPVSQIDGTRIGNNNNSITVAASDNAKLSNLKIEYKTNSLFSSYTTLKEITGNAKNNCTATVSLPIDDISSGTEITLRITASDSSGNAADEKTVTYIVDKDAPQIKNVALTEKDGNVFSISWTAEDEDLSHFYIYRKRGGDTAYSLYDSVMAESGKTSYTYTDDEISVSDKSVIYKIEGFDTSKNTSSVETEQMKVSGIIAPIPLLECQSTVVMGSEYLFDASASTDDTGVVSYSFDFGDGTQPITDEDGKVLHLYDKTGKYTLTLSVVDTDGNTAKITREITVTSRELMGTVSVSVKDDSGNILPNTDVYMDLGEESQQHMVTDSKGVAIFELPVGTHTVSSYKENYLPVKNDISVTSSDLAVSLVLINEPIVTGEFEIHKMTFDEIVAAGIDINAAENRNVVKINVTLMYERVPINSVIYWNGHTAKAEPIYVKTSNGTTRKLTPCIVGGGGSYGSFGGGGTANIENPTIIYIDVPVEFSYLKEFFSVSLHIINHASSEFSLVDNTVTLNVPNGLSIVKTNCSEPKATAFIKEIAGQSQETVKWVLRGDKPGTYDISADFLGILSYFNEPVSATFKSDDPIVVHDASTINVEVEAAEKSYGGKIFYNIVVENQGDFALEGFKWEKLTESFVDEYVDANGNSYEMTEQRTTLKPGEKFIYHNFAEVGGMYKYIDKIVDDLNSSGAKVSVSLHEPEYFLEKYYDKFPEESGAFVFTIVDTSGNIIKDATVELSSDLSYETDEQGRVIISAEDRKTIECAYLKVTADGYYDYLDKNFSGVKFGKSTKVTLYRTGEFGIAKVLVDGKDSLSSRVSIRTNQTNSDGSPATVTFISQIYGEVDSVDIVQKNKKLTAKSKATNSAEHLYKNTYLASDFVPQESVYLYIKLKSGEIKQQELNISTFELNYNDITVDLPEDASLTIDDSPYEWLNGLTYEFQFSDKIGLSCEYNASESTLTCGVNFDIEKELENGNIKHETDSNNSSDSNNSNDSNNSGDSNNSNGSDNSGDSNNSNGSDNSGDSNNSNSSDDSDNTDYESLKGHTSYSEIVEKCKKQYKELLESNGMNDDSSTFNFSIQGAIEFKVKDNGTLELSKSKLFLGISIGYEYSAQCVVGIIPLTMTVGFSLGIGAEASFVYNDTAGTCGFEDLDLLIDLGVDLQAGVGVKCVSFGLYGAANLTFDIDINKTFEMKKVELAGDVGLYVEFLFYSDRFSIVSATTTLYDRDADKKSKSFADLYSVAYNPESYTLNTDLLSYNSGWNSEVAVGSGNTTLLNNAYSSVKPQIAVCGDKAVMVYQSVDSNAENAANALALYYSIYDETTGKWSVPSKLDDNRCADMAYSLAVCDNQVYIVYTQSNSELSDDIAMTDAVKSIDVYAASFNFTTNKFDNFSRLTENNTYDALPVIKSINGVPTAVWTNSSSNNPFLNDQSNSIMTSSFINGKWTQAESVIKNINTVINCDLIESSKNGYIVYTCDKDGNLSTPNDKAIYLYDVNTASTVTVADNVETSVATGEILDKSVIIWYENGSLMQYDIASDSKTEICNISGSVAQGAEIVSDGNGNCSIVYTESRNKVCALNLDTASGKWSAPVTLATSDNYIENVEAEYINGKLTLMYYDTCVVDDDMNTESDLVTTVADTNAKPIITNAVIDYSEIEAGKEASVEVSVTNNSFEPTGNLTFTVTNYNGDLLGTFTTTDKSLSAGESGKFNVPFTAPEEIVNRCITVTVTDSREKYSSSYDINLGYTDMTVFCEQVIDGNDSFIKATVYNNFSYDSPATLEVYNRFSDEVYYTRNISNVAKNSPVTVTIPLDSSYIDESGFVSVRVKSKAADYYDFNNSDMFEFYDVTASDKRVLLGDVDGNGEITVFDTTVIQMMIADINNSFDVNIKAADVNLDGEVNIVDVTAIQMYLVESASGYGYCGSYRDSVIINE